MLRGRPSLCAIALPACIYYVFIQNSENNYSKLRQEYVILSQCKTVMF